MVELSADDMDWIHATCRDNLEESVKAILAKQERSGGERFEDE